MDKPFPSRLFEVSEEPFYHQGESLFCGTLRDRDHLLQLPSFPAYCTVSYVWGPTRLLTVNSVSWGVPITNEHKLTFMLEACRRMGFQYVWIDTLCIDQSSDEDKGREVVKMREYYGNSLATVVFGDKYEVFASNWSKLEPILSVWETDQAGYKEETLRTVWEGLGDVNRVMADGWFWRVWTLQEAVIPLATETCTLLTSDGDPMRLDVLANLIMWTTRALAVGQLNARSGKAAYDWVHPSSGVVYTYPTSGPWCEILREILSAMGSKTHKMHPIKLLELTRDRHSSNPVDRLRGAYGFVEEKWQVNDMEVHREVALQPGLDEAEKQEMTFQILWRKSVEKYFDDGVHDCVSLLSMRVTQFPNRTWDCAPALPTQRPGGGKWNMDVWLRWREISEGWELARFPHGSIGHEVGRWINPTAKVSEKGELSLKIAHLEPLAMIVNHSFGDGSGDLFALYNTLEHFSEKYDISTILALLKDAVRGTLSSLVTAGEMDATVARSFSQTPKEHLCLDDFFAILSIQGNSFSNGLRDVFAGWDRWIVTVRDGRAFLAWFPYHDVERLLRV
ncbi:hypothetical protein ONZ45_g11389 [Pleurotus djamor]|nr:hypothetical protein ONZ45_g11389 [Pleurotus djamor]